MRRTDQHGAEKSSACTMEGTRLERNQPMAKVETDTQASMSTWVVEVYEPAVDPGGYKGVFTVKAADKTEAGNVALEQAREKSGVNEGLAVSKIVRLL